MSSFSVYEDLITYMDKDWMENIFIAAGIFDDDKFSIYDKRESYNENMEIQHLQIKNGLFQKPSFFLVCNKICQLVMIGDIASRGKRNVCFFDGANEKFVQITSTSLFNTIQNKIKEFEYLQNNGNNVFYFPYNGMKTKTFFSFIQLGKNEYLVENIDGNITSDDKNIRQISDMKLLKTVINDCYQN